MERGSNAHIAELLRQMGDLLEIRGDSHFRIRALRRAADAVENLPERASSMLDKGTLTKVPGIGSGVVARVKEIVETGDCSDRQQLLQEVGQGTLDLLEVEGIGPKTVRLVSAELGISSVDELEAAARAGNLAQLPRMGEKSQAKIIAAIEAYRRHRGRIPLGRALPQGRALAAALAEEPAVARIELAGSSRRRRETIGDLDLLVASTRPDEVMDRFVALPQVRDVMLRGETKCSVHLEGGLQVDLRVVAPESFGAALHYFTGSKTHNIAIRDRGKRRGLKVNEYAVTRESDGQRVGGATEEEIFAAVELPFIPAELREGQGEVEAAESGRLPQLVQPGDLRGDLHLHTDATDGHASLQQMARAAEQAGLSYIAITDHSRALTVARGLDPERLAQQVRQIRALEQQLGSLRLLAGIEVDILADGALDLPESSLRALDWIVASVHSHFNLSREDQTKRVLRSMESGLVDCLGHPSGRLLGQRDGYPLEMDRVIGRAAELGVALEINAHPDRLDLDAPHCRQAREVGARLVISSDAHRPEHLGRCDYGVYTARRGWLEPADVLNCGPVSDIEAWHAAR